MMKIIQETPSSGREWPEWRGTPCDTTPCSGTVRFGLYLVFLLRIVCGVTYTCFQSLITIGLVGNNSELYLLYWIEPRTHCKSFWCFTMFCCRQVSGMFTWYPLAPPLLPPVQTKPEPSPPPAPSATTTTSTTSSSSTSSWTWSCWWGDSASWTCSSCVCSKSEPFCAS